MVSGKGKKKNSQKYYLIEEYCSAFFMVASFSSHSLLRLKCLGLLKNICCQKPFLNLGESPSSS